LVQISVDLLIFLIFFSFFGVAKMAVVQIKQNAPAVGVSNGIDA